MCSLDRTIIEVFKVLHMATSCILLVCRNFGITKGIFRRISKLHYGKRHAFPRLDHGSRVRRARALNPALHTPLVRTLPPPLRPALQLMMSVLISRRMHHENAAPPPLERQRKFRRSPVSRTCALTVVKRGFPNRTHRALIIQNPSAGPLSIETYPRALIPSAGTARSRHGTRAGNFPSPGHRWSAGRPRSAALWWTSYVRPQNPVQQRCAHFLPHLLKQRL